VSSGRGVHEALAAAERCAGQGLTIGVVDMPSIDAELLLSLYDSGKLLCIAEQNNGYIWQNLVKLLFQRRPSLDTGRIMAINTLGRDARPRFIHSGTYEELLEAFGLAPAQLAETIRRRVL
jgi:transketolase